MSYIERFIKAQIMVFYGLGILYSLQLTGMINLTVQGISISPDQAHAIQNKIEYFNEEVITPPKKRK